ncbi:MAG: radical SAM protein [Pseudomonadota bacterium]
MRPDQRRAIQSKSLHVPLGPSKIADNVNVACPIGCEFCFLTVEKMNNGTAAKMTNFVTSNLRNLKLVHFCGGEPFLQKTTRRILREASQVDDPPKFEFVTSLSYLDDDLRQRITASKLHYVNVSVNAATRMTYQKTIARGNWERLIENLDFIEGARGSGQLMMSFVVTRSNFHEIEQFAHFCQRWSPASIHYHTLKPGTENYEDLQLNREQAKSVLDQLKAPIFTQLGHKAHVVVLRDMCRAIAGQAAAA